MIMSRPVFARISRIASSVASVPEFANRHSGSLKRSDEVLADHVEVLRRLREMRAAVGRLLLIASTIFGCACPTTIAP